MMHIEIYQHCRACSSFSACPCYKILRHFQRWANEQEERKGREVSLQQEIIHILNEGGELTVNELERKTLYNTETLHRLLHSLVTQRRIAFRTRMSTFPCHTTTYYYLPEIKMEAMQ